MASEHADRNLLLGIAALQNGFIKRDDLIAAMNDWVLEKRTPLEDILRRRGALSDDVYRLLVTLVNKQLELHGHNAERSLAALGNLGAVRDELVSLADPQVDASLRHVPAGHYDVYATQSIGASSSDGARFRILRPHAEGGLGKVFVAMDNELNREVALKEIKGQCADNPAIRTRFTIEAEITGGLEHPGVVPVYGLGAYADGRPFYAMRFIRGDSLKDAIDRFHKTGGGNGEPKKRGDRTLGLHKLLRRFTDVCNAMEYAHSRGVLHRDLKPGNVMLGKYGETLVVDWGLAKAFGGAASTTWSESITARGLADEPLLMPVSGTGTAPTQMGSAVGTPSYMSPEQAAGRLDQLGPASDIYSLGATLYHLLTGEPPFQANRTDLGEVLRKVQRGDFPPPRTVKKSIPRPLEAICLKAMSLKPADRYASASALAEDLQHWLADEPTQALPDPITQRGLRWLRHNWAWAFTAAAAILLVAIVSTTAGIIVNQQKHDILIAKQQADVAKNEAISLAASEATAKNQARDAIDKYVEAVQEELHSDEQFQPLRKRLLKDARVYYEAFIKDHRHNERDQQEVADALIKVGVISDSSGSTDEALESYRAALNVRQKLADENAFIKDGQRDVAGIHNVLGILHEKTGALDEAAESYRAALDIQRKLAEENPASAEYQGHLANTHNNLAALQRKRGARDDALKSYRAALDAYQKLAEKNPRDSKYQRLLANCYNNIGKVQEEQREEHEAMQSYRAALEILTKSTPDNPLDLNLLAHIQSNLGGLQEKRGEREEALKSYRAALEIRENLAKQNPLAKEYQNNLANTYNNLGTLHNSSPDEALKLYQAALEIRQKLARDNPRVPDFQKRLATNHLNIAELWPTSGSRNTAAQSLAEADSILKGFKEQFPDEPLEPELLARYTQLRESLAQEEQTNLRSAERPSK